MNTRKKGDLVIDNLCRNISRKCNEIREITIITEEKISKLTLNSDKNEAKKIETGAAINTENTPMCITYLKNLIQINFK